MKVQDGISLKTGLAPARSLPSDVVRGRLMRSDDGTLVLRSREGDLPVRLLNADLPLDQLLTLQVVGKEGTSLILSAGQKSLPDSLLDLLNTWNLEPTGPWMDLAAALFDENLPITQDNLMKLERWTRIVEHRWGVKVNPRIIAYLLAKGLPLKPETLILALHRLFPELRKEFPEEVLRREDLLIDPEDVKTMTSLLQDSEQLALESGEELSWIGMFQTETRMTADGGEIHWRRESSERNGQSGEQGILLELFPVDLGWVRSYISWDNQAFHVMFEVDAEYLEDFRQAIPVWQDELAAKGYKVVVDLREQDPFSMKEVKPVDRWA